MLTDATRDMLQRRIDQLEGERDDLREALRIERDDLARERNARQDDFCRIANLTDEVAALRVSRDDLREHLAFLVARATPVPSAEEADGTGGRVAPITVGGPDTYWAVAWAIYLGREEFEAARRAAGNTGAGDTR